MVLLFSMLLISFGGFPGHLLVAFEFTVSSEFLGFSLPSSAGL